MTHMHISLPADIQALIEATMARDGFASPAEYLTMLIRDDQKRRARQALEAKLLEGLQGDAVEMTPADWDAIEQEAQARYAARQTRA